MSTISENLMASSREIPDQVAITLLYNKEPKEAISYSTLFKGASRYAGALAREGIQPGEVAVLIYNHGPDLVYSFFGTILNGSIPAIMPFLTEKLSPEQYRASLSALIEITSPAAILTYPAFVHEVEAANADGRVRRILTPMVVDQMDEIAPGNGFSGLNQSADEIALLQHSSGTTGLQKGVALSHQAIFNQIQSYSHALQLSSEDVIVSWLPLYHDMGLIAGFILPILYRIPLVLLSPFDWVRAPYRLMQAVSDFNGTLSWLPNFAYNFCAKKIRDRDLEGVNLSSWRAVINCSEPMVWKSHQLFLERFCPYGLHPEALATSYAMAENVFAVTQGGINETVEVDWIDQKALAVDRIAIPVTFPPKVGSEENENKEDTRLKQHQVIAQLSAGRPINGTEVRVIDPTGKNLPERHLGEIAIRSNCMLTGYYHRPDLTEKAFLDGWYLTGDLGYLAGGEVYITGRKKDLIIVGGKNVYPQDLERLLDDLEGIHPGRVVAFGIFNDDLGTEEVVIIAELEEKPGTATNQTDRNQELTNEIRLRINQGSDIAVRHVHLVGRNWLLKTSSGKIARNANREKWLTEAGIL